MIGKLKDLKEKVCVSSSVIADIKLGIKNAQKQTNSQVGTISLTESEDLAMIEYTEENKRDWRSYWANLLLEVIGIEVVDETVDDYDIYNSASKWLMDSDIQSVELARKNGYILVSDDLFIRKLAMTVSSADISTNIVGFLVSTSEITIVEAFDMVYKLGKYNYVYAIDGFVLFELYQSILLMGEKDSSEKYWSMIEDIFSSLLNDLTGSYYLQTFNMFINLVSQNGLFTPRLYDIIRQPLKLKPYREQVQDTLNKLFKIENDFV